MGSMTQHSKKLAHYQFEVVSHCLPDYQDIVFTVLLVCWFGGIISLE